MKGKFRLLCPRSRSGHFWAVSPRKCEQRNIAFLLADSPATPFGSAVRAALLLNSKPDPFRQADGWLFRIQNAVRVLLSQWLCATIPSAANARWNSEL